MFSAATLAGFALKAANWLFSFAQKRSDNALETYRVKTGLDIEKVKADATVAVAAQNAAAEMAGEGTKRQLGKFNHPVFWSLIVAALGPAILNLWMLWLYNFLWWPKGIWPQSWSIAAYPPQAAVWVDMSMRWLFDPVALPVTVGTAATVALLTGKRR